MKILTIVTAITLAALAVQAVILAVTEIRRRRRKTVVDRLRTGLEDTRSDMVHRTQSFRKRAGSVRDDVRLQARKLMERATA